MRTKLYAACAAFLLSAVITGAQDKVYFVHGLNDNHYTWYTYKTQLVDGLNRGSSIWWDSRDSLSVAAKTLNGQGYIGSGVQSGNRAIVFGHSAGGLIAREAAQNNTTIRAVITAGTPNNGAGIAKHLRAGTIGQVADKALTKLKLSVVSSTLAIRSLWTGLTVSTAAQIAGVETAALTLCQAVGLGILENFQNNNYTCQAVDDMIPGSDFLEKLNEQSPRVPVINLYGNEQDPRLIRLAGTCLKKGANDSPDNTTDECYDETLLPVYNGLLAGFTGLEVFHYTTATVMAVMGFWNSYWLASSGLNLAAGISWSTTTRYFQYDIHKDWANLIGAVHTDRVENWRKFLWWTWCDVEYVQVYENSDGFIPNNSSKMDESRGPNTKNIEVIGVNHLEMNSHPSMRAMLNDILNGKNNNYDDAFRYAK